MKVYNPDSHVNPGKHVDVAFNQPMSIPVFSPFPFETFSSLDYMKDVFKAYDPTYLLVEADLTEKQEKGMKSSGIMYHRFHNHMVTVLAEFHEPFVYALDMLGRYGKRLGTYHLTTWLIHEETRSDMERRAMETILKRALSEKANTEYPLDITLDTYTLPYVDFLSKQKGRVTFGQYGSIAITAEDMRTIPLSIAGYLFLWKTARFDPAFCHYPAFGVPFYDQYIKDTAYEPIILGSLYRNAIAELAATGFDMDYVFARFLSHRLDGWSETNQYESLRELVMDARYEISTHTHDPYEYYCCEDCDGYMMEDEPYDYAVDEQVDALSEILEDWEPHLSIASIPLFREWSPDIFRRYREAHPGSAFGVLLQEAYAPVDTI